MNNRESHRMRINYIEIALEKFIQKEFENLEYNAKKKKKTIHLQY